MHVIAEGIKKNGKQKLGSGRKFKPLSYVVTCVWEMTEYFIESGYSRRKKRE